MGSHDQQLKNPRYRDWVKAGLALKYLKDGLEEFVDDEVKDQQISILEDVRKDIGCPDATCDQCPIEILLPAHKRGSCGQGRCFCSYNPHHIRRSCPNDVCGRMYDRVVQQHMHSRPSWINTDSTKWCSSHWEIAKCFLDGGGYEDKGSAADTDCKGLLSIITNNMFLQRNVDTPIDKMEPKTDVFSKSKEARNEILHTASLQLSAEKLNDYVDVMIQLLGDRGKLHTYKHATQAVSKLRQLKETCLSISTDDEFETRDAALKAIQEKKQEALDEIDDKQKEILQNLQIEHLQETLDKLSKTSTETTNSLVVRQESLEHRQTLLERSVKQMQELHSESSKKIEEFQLDLARLKTRLNSFDKVELLHENTLVYLKHKKEVKEKLCHLYSKHLATIPVPTILEKLGARVDDFYMELKICDYSARRYNRSAYLHHGNTVRNLHDIFYKENKRVENVYLLGNAGTGKTTWCLKLIDYWLQGNRKQTSVCTNVCSPNESLMLEFDIVLLVSLRSASKELDLIEMIHNQIFHQTPELLVYTKEVLKAEPDKCLVIVDGLDEWNTPDDQVGSALGQDPSFPSRKDMNHCTVVTTSRPWKLDEVRPNNSIIGRIVVIQGLKNSSDIRNLAGKVISKLNTTLSPEMTSTVTTTKDKTNLEDFVQEVKRRFYTPDYLFFPDLMNIPLIVIFMVLRWFKDGSLERTMAGNYSSLIENIFDHEEGYRNLKPRYGQKPKFDGRLSRIPYIEEAKREWSKEMDVLPDCLKKCSVCVQYSGLILKLCKFAFEGLFEHKGNALIFSEEVLLNEISPEELEASVKSGLLSKINVIGGPSLEMSKLSFLHKTVQEYMAAIYIAVHQKNEDISPVQKFEKYCTTFRSLYEMENVMLFVCGMDASLATKMLLQVSVVEESQTKENLCDIDFFLKCVKEIKEGIYGTSMTMEPFVSFIQDIFTHFEDVFEFSKISSNPIGDIEIDVSFIPEKDDDKMTNFFSPGNYSVFNLVTLKPEYFPLQQSCTATNTSKSFRLRNLKYHCYEEDCKGLDAITKQKFGRVVLDFSDCTKTEKVEMTMVTTFRMCVFSKAPSNN